MSNLLCPSCASARPARLSPVPASNRRRCGPQRISTQAVLPPAVLTSSPAVAMLPRTPQNLTETAVSSLDCIFSLLGFPHCDIFQAHELEHLDLARSSLDRRRPMRSRDDLRPGKLAGLLADQYLGIELLPQRLETARH